MATDAFSSLLQDLGAVLGLELKPDQNNACLLQLQEGVEVQMELNRNGESLLIEADLGFVPVGKYRANLFREALKANGMPSPRFGTFAYSKQADQMILFETLVMSDLTADKLIIFLTSFAKKAKTWKDAIASGEVPEIETTEPGPSTAKTGMFGLRP